jgi:hypothetical protein
MAEATQKVEENAQLDRVRPGDSATEMSFRSGEAFALLQRAATVMSRSSLVPAIYQNSVANCAIALNIASRVGADPLMVMQNLYIVYNRPAWSAQFLIATINQSRQFSKIRYEWKGGPGTRNDGDDGWGCRAWATEKETGEKLYGSWVTWKLAKDEGWVDKNGSKWKTMPEQMFMYRAGAWFVKAYAPELSMGIKTADELADSIDTVETAPGVYEIKDDQWEEAPKNGKEAADQLAQRLKAERESQTAENVASNEPQNTATQPTAGAQAEQAPSDEGGKGQEAAESQPEANGATAGAIGDDFVEKQKSGLADAFEALKDLKGKNTAQDELEASTGTRVLSKVPPEKYGVAIAALNQRRMAK